MPPWGGATGHENAVSSRDREGAVEAISRAHPSLTVGAQISVIFIRAIHAGLAGATKHENPLRWREGVKKLGGRASWRAVTPASPCPMRLGGSLALPISAGFEFFHTFRGVGVGCYRWDRPTPEG